MKEEKIIIDGKETSIIVEIPKEEIEYDISSEDNEKTLDLSEIVEEAKKETKEEPKDE